jgi:predicted amidohydrolase
MRVASFQRFPIFDDPALAAKSITHDLRWADERGVDLAIFPECYLQGHAYDRSTIERRAVALGDPPVQDLLRQLAPVKATAIIGFFERRGSGVFNSAMLIEKGKIVGAYSKAHPNEEGVLAGIEFPVFDRSGCSFGINICFDANFPEAAEKAVGGRADLLCYPLSNLLAAEKADTWRSKSLENLKARAGETRCWVASADVTGRHGGLVAYGCTAIINPDGQVVAQAPELREGVALFDLPAGREERRRPLGTGAAP